MAEKRSSTGKVTTLHGYIVTSSVDAGRIEEISLPALDNNFVLVTTRDIPGTNRVRVLDASTPLLTSSTISYYQQPILALFGYDTESVQLKSKEINISYQLPSREEPAPQQEVKPFSYQFGNLESATKEEGLEVLERTYRYSGSNYESNTLSRISVVLEDDILHITTPTQWPSHVRETVSDVTGIPKRRIVIHREPFFAPHDEMLITPSTMCAIASVACLKGNCPVEILLNAESFRPDLTIKRKTWYFKDGRVQAESILVAVDQGSVSMFSDEMANQLIAGLVPLYPLISLSISITFNTSRRRPAHFFGDLGYSDALCSTETHYSALAKLSGYNPLTWRLKFASESSTHSQVIRSDKYAKLKELIATVSDSSDFQRKNAAYEMQAQMRVKLSTFFNYSRGVALACGAGISGFSSECRSLPQQPVQITLKPNNKVEVNTSFYTIGSSAEIWRQIISEELQVAKSDISFVEEQKEMLDSGPSVLSANSGRMPQQIQKACNQIKEKRFVQPLPICESVLSPKQPGMKGSMFLSNSWVATVLELEIDSVTLRPLVRRVWCAVSLSRVFEEQILRSKIRHTIVTTLREAGALLSHSDTFTIEITIKDEGQQISSSITSALKGVITSAFVSALEQALGFPVGKIPVDGNTLLGALRGNV
ncbi:molybdopterin cofactor-binding domain-containing protein [Sphaerochaeta halotolerans]|uniref:molybdopterin cofactor-binding domain-containing protein n=1 Tax=Sphaerochaeta halotolerans TaxID=2293840 RepID=UPI001371D89F|nr:molybdopterin cofactor-binding domain-containing protein [Sphaerochaeta halotolerans]MXI87323.1 molybdopterin-dependent oxidoreductase [Sphaerochaeta halotolerans]